MIKKYLILKVKIANLNKIKEFYKTRYSIMKTESEIYWRKWNTTEIKTSNKKRMKETKKRKMMKMKMRKNLDTTYRNQTSEK